MLKGLELKESGNKSLRAYLVQMQIPGTISLQNCTCLWIQRRGKVLVQTVKL